MMVENANAKGTGRDVLGWEGMLLAIAVLGAMVRLAVGCLLRCLR